jgi:Fur family transcriptional regulator, ferric uptake regulator
MSVDTDEAPILASNVVADRQAKLHEALQQRGLRNTKQREILTNIFFSYDRHFSHDELLALARQRDSGIGYATVYRTLKLLTELGLANELHFDDGHARFEAADGRHHDHLICVACSKIVEFEMEEIEQLQEKVATQNRFRLIHHRMELYGICPECIEKEDAS